MSKFDKEIGRSLFRDIKGSARQGLMSRFSGSISSFAFAEAYPLSAERKIQ